MFCLVGSFISSPISHYCLLRLLMILSLSSWFLLNVCEIVSSPDSFSPSDLCCMCNILEIILMASKPTIWCLRRFGSLFPNNLPMNYSVVIFSTSGSTMFFALSLRVWDMSSVMPSPNTDWFAVLWGFLVSLILCFLCLPASALLVRSLVFSLVSLFWSIWADLSLAVCSAFLLLPPLSFLLYSWVWSLSSSWA